MYACHYLCECREMRQVGNSDDAVTNLRHRRCCHQHSTDSRCKRFPLYFSRFPSGGGGFSLYRHAQSATAPCILIFPFLNPYALSLVLLTPLLPRTKLHTIILSHYTISYFHFKMWFVELLSHLYYVTSANSSTLRKL